MKIKSINYFYLFMLMFFVSELSIAQIQITLPSTTGAPGEVKSLPVTVNDLTSYNIYSYQIQIDYDKTIMKINGISTTGTVMTGAGDPQVNPDTTNGFIRIVWATGNHPLSGSGVLVYLNIKLKTAGNSNIYLDSTYSNKFYNENVQAVAFTVTNGIITVNAVNNPPVFNSIPNQTVNEGDTLTFTVSATDPENDPIVLTHGTLPQGASFDSTTGVFTWQPNYEQAGQYDVIFYANDGHSTSQITVHITVVNTNRAPVFTKEPADSTRVPVHNVPVYYQFQYEAQDPDGDPLVFSLVSNDLGNASMSTTGKFLWAPVPAQAGLPYNVKVQVSDGTASTISSKILIVADTVTGVQKNDGLPKIFSLSQNYPNPFNPSTTIEFEIPKQTHVTLEIYNILGQKVAELVNKDMSPGRYRINFDANNLQSGIYFYTLVVDDRQFIKKMIVLK
ncbi:cohesin domain-containing protein [Melioribacteraceae bacterium 4301-Me]|uniref:cohesin domain-containing protein n=1 Tax=Pyranulibacter aquaticus TaxID=3163344 RepID=UPI003599CE2B